MSIDKNENQIIDCRGASSEPDMDCTAPGCVAHGVVPTTAAADLQRIIRQRDQFKHQAENAKMEHAFAVKAWVEEVHAKDVSAAMVEFFIDLSVLVRQTPAPCPCCGNEDVWQDEEPVECSNCGLRGPFDSETREDGLSDCIQMWNSIAVPAAYRRLMVTV